MALALAVGAGCEKKSEPPQPQDQQPPQQPAQAPQPAPPSEPTGAGGAGTGRLSAVQTAEQAQAMFKTVCATCHGESGRGDGPGAAALSPKPRNYTDKAWQASVTDEEIRQIIVQGGAAVGKSPSMPAHPQLQDKPEVADALVQLIRSFGG